MWVLTMATIIDLGERRTARASDRAWSDLTGRLGDLAAQAAAPIRFQPGDRVQLRDGAQRPDWYDPARASAEVWGEIVATPYGNRRAIGWPVFNVLWRRWVPADGQCGACGRVASGASQRPCSHHGRWHTELAWYMCQNDLNPYRPLYASENP